MGGAQLAPLGLNSFIPIRTRMHYLCGVEGDVHGALVAAIAAHAGRAFEPVRLGHVERSKHNGAWLQHKQNHTMPR